MNALKPRKGFVQDELNIERLTPIQWDGIMRAMHNYAKHYHETMQANDFEKPQEQCTIPVVVGQSEQLKCFIAEEFAQCYNPKKNSECISCKHY